MERIKKGLGNLGVVLALAAGLAAWAVLPWYAILVIAVGLALWLALTHQGRLAIAASQMGVASLPAALGRFRRHRGRDSGCGRRAGRAARDGSGVRSDAQHNGQRRQCDRPAWRIAVRDELDHHPRPDTADRKPRRHRPRQGRPAAGVPGTVASGEHGDQGRWYGCQRAAARRRPERMGAAPAGQGDRRAQVQSRHARAGGRPGREATIRRSRGRQSGRARQQPLDGGRHFRVRRRTRLGVVGGQRNRCQHLPSYRVSVRDGKARRQGRIRAAQGRDGGRSPSQAGCRHHAALLLQAVGEPHSIPEDTGHRDRYHHGHRRGLRRAQHDVRSRSRPRARDRDDARDRASAVCRSSWP